MGIETDLNVAPYYDDIENALAANYHRVLFKPAVPVQARELTQLQDILQNQIERFGDNIFVSGTIIKGCNFSYDSNYHYAKILDLRPIDNQPVLPSSYVGLLSYELSSNLYAICYNYQDGYESQTPNLKTLYFKYLNTGTGGQSSFSPGSQITFYNTTEISEANSTTSFANADVKIATGSDAVGKGYAMTVSSGVIFQKGHFIQVPGNETVIVSKYSQQPNNVVAGFLINENLVSYNQDANLLDNATGYPNYSAPGADRLQLLPELVAYAADQAPSNNFFSLVEWQNGNIVRSFQETEYSIIGNEMAQRTYESSGNFVVKPFKVSMQDANATHNFAVVSAGLAYIDGHRVEQLNNVYVPVRKGTDAKLSSGQLLQTTFDNSVLVGELIGTFKTNAMAPVSLRDVSGNRISNGQYSTTAAPGNEIGTAKVLALQYNSGTIGTPDCFWKLYLTDIDMNLGKNFRDVKSIYSNSSVTGVFGIADIVRTLDTTSNNYVATLQNSNRSSLVFPSAKSGLINLSQSAILPKFIYRTISNTTITGTTGNSASMQLTTSTYPYGKGDLTSNELTSIVIVPTAIQGGATSANVTLTKAGTVGVATGSANVTGTSTTFSSDYEVGDFIYTNSVIRRIVNIANNTFLTVDRTYGSTASSLAHTKTYPINVPINIQQRNTRVTVTDTAAQYMSVQLVAANGVNETLDKDITISVHHNAALTALDRNLQYNANLIVRINTGNNSAGISGPWCLGIPYPYKINKVYKSSNTGILVGNTNGTTTLAADTTGFSNGVVLIGPGIAPGTTANVSSPTAFVLSTAATGTVTNSAIKWAYYSNSSKDDVTSSFYLQNGQTDTLFEQGFLAFNPSSMNTTIANGDLLTVVFDAFRPQNADRGYISIESYSTLIGSNNLSYETIPSYIDRNNSELFLRDSIDFRQFVSNSALYSNTIETSTVNPVYTNIPANIVNNPPTPNTELYIAAPDQHFQYDAYHYVGRIDKLAINSFGKYQIIEGKPSETPTPPSDSKGLMTLAIIDVPPFPSYTTTLFTTNVASSYTTSSTINQNRVYTMKDIAKLDNRLKNIEYYTSLNLLEQQTSSLKIVSDVTGANRFKNGIFVDNFTTTDLFDLDNPEFKASLSTSESALVPMYTMDKINLSFANGSGVVSNGSVIRLSADTTNSEISIIRQGIATETFQCSTTAYNYNGTIIVVPKVDPIPKICNRKWETGTAQPTRNPTPPVTTTIIPYGSTVALIEGGFDTTSLKAGQPVYWRLAGGGYSSITVTITGPNGYTYSEVLTSTILSGVTVFSAGGWINYTYPGTYSISLTKVLQSGYTSENISKFNYTLNVNSIVPFSTPDTGRGVGSVTGTLTTIVIADTSTVIVPPVSNNNFGQVGNNAVGGGLVSINNLATYKSFVQSSPFNLDLLGLLSGTPNTTTSTTSSFKTTATPDINTSIAIPGIFNDISLKPVTPFGSLRLNYI